MKKMPLLSVFSQLFKRTRPGGSSNDQDTVRHVDLSERVTDVGYHQEISFRYHSAQMITIMLLAVYIAVSVLTNAELLSADNLIYFTKDLTSSLALQENEAKQSIIFSSDADNDYVLYRQGLAVLGKQKLTVFTATGRESHSHRMAYRTPRLVSSGRYLVAYDLGGKNMSLYNSFTCVKNITTENNIRSVAACNQGYYAVVTDGTEYASEVLLYNENHRMINRYRLEEYTLLAALRPDGKQLSIISVSSEGGRMQTHISQVSPNEQTWGNACVIKDAYPVACHYTDEGELFLLTTSGAYRLDTKLEIVASCAFSTENVLSFRVDAQGCVLVCRDNVYDNASRVIVFDKSTDQVYNISVPSEVHDATYASGTLAVLTENELNVYRNGQSAPSATAAFNGEYTRLLAYDDDEYLVCGSAKAIVLRPDERT